MQSAPDCTYTSILQASDATGNRKVCFRAFEMHSVTVKCLIHASVHCPADHTVFALLVLENCTTSLTSGSSIWHKQGVTDYLSLLMTLLLATTGGI